MVFGSLCSTPALRRHVAATSSPVARVLADEGGVFLGKGIMSELDLGATGNTVSYGIVHNVRRWTTLAHIVILCLLSFAAGSAVPQRRIVVVALRK